MQHNKLKNEATLTYNTYALPNLDGLSPFELVFSRKAKILPDLELTPTALITVTDHKYLEKLQKQLTFVRKHIQKFRDNRVELMNKGKFTHGHTVGQFVYLYLPGGAIMQTSSKKITCKFVGPLVIYKAVSPSQFLLMSLKEKSTPG